MALIIDMLSLSIEVIREKKKVYYGEIEEKENIIFTFNNKVILHKRHSFSNEKNKNIGNGTIFCFFNLKRYSSMC